MRPLAVLNAILFGSATAITFGLCAVLFIYLILQGRHPQLAAELGPLLRSSGLFVVLTIVSGLSLFSTLKGLAWRWMAQLAMWVMLAITAMLYWPQ